MQENDHDITMHTLQQSKGGRESRVRECDSWGPSQASFKEVLVEGEERTRHDEHHPRDLWLLHRLHHRRTK